MNVFVFEFKFVAVGPFIVEEVAEDDADEVGDLFVLCVSLAVFAPLVS